MSEQAGGFLWSCEPTSAAPWKTPILCPTTLLNRLDPIKEPRTQPARTGGIAESREFRRQTDRQDVLQPLTAKTASRELRKVRRRGRDGEREREPERRRTREEGMGTVRDWPCPIAEFVFPLFSNQKASNRPGPLLFLQDSIAMGNAELRAQRHVFRLAAVSVACCQPKSSTLVSTDGARSISCVIGGRRVGFGVDWPLADDPKAVRRCGEVPTGNGRKGTRDSRATAAGPSKKLGSIMSCWGVWALLLWPSPSREVPELSR
ncbi:hypothetical protein F4780DRAFT_744653 [Xylariomycetidae sp. FL0641]|nr:hypothetical protein F4780DRAFT_744653 [Xylariomycetidae sp. FL0641]